MDLQHCHLTSSGGQGIQRLLALMQLQNTYINKIYRVIYMVGADFGVASSSEFQEFVCHFNLFVQHHASSEGFGRAIDAVQVYYTILLERLLDTQILSAAEALEAAVTHLEMAMRQPQLRANMQIALLNERISLLEETELRIIEMIEGLLEDSRQLSLQN